MHCNSLHVSLGSPNSAGFHHSGCFCAIRLLQVHGLHVQGQIFWNGPAARWWPRSQHGTWCCWVSNWFNPTIFDIYWFIWTKSISRHVKDAIILTSKEMERKNGRISSVPGSSLLLLNKTCKPMKRSKRNWNGKWSVSKTKKIIILCILSEWSTYRNVLICDGSNRWRICCSVYWYFLMRHSSGRSSPINRLYLLFYKIARFN